MPTAIPTVAELDHRFAIPGVAHVQADPTGNPVVRIATEKCLGAIHLHGAQVTSWKPAGTPEVIFLSSKAQFEQGKAIRGGIPICFPWFRAKADSPSAPAHGFLRTKLWTLDAVQNASAGVRVSMSTSSDATTKEWWPCEFRAQLSATFGSKLGLEFTVTNTGAAAFAFEEALHTYHLIGDVHQASILGLQDAPYLDNSDGNRQKTQQGAVTINSPTDRAYLDTPNTLELHDPVLQRRIHIAKQNSRTTVIWNPWEAAANKMSDMGPGEWQKFLCAEAANILTDSVHLPPGNTHTVSVTVSVAPL